MCWRKFCTEAESIKDIAKIVKILKPKPQVGISLFNYQGRTLTPSETLGNLMDTHFIESVGGSTDEDNEVEAVSNRFDDVNTYSFVDYIDPQKVRVSLASFGPLKAAGPDGLKPLALQKLTDKLILYITSIYRTCVFKGYAPKVWRAMKVVFLPKVGKKDYGQAKSYRPITLSNFLLKGLERLVQWYANDHLLVEPLHAQHAYTVGKSCDSAISEVVDFIESNNYRGNHVIAVSLDCSGAFDRIKFDSAEEAMRVKQFPSGIRELYLSILKHRTVSAELQGERMVRIPKRGSPQGGVLSPLIWNLIMDTILSKFKGRAVRVVGYADDIMLLVGGKDPGTLVSLINEALEEVLNWGDKNGLVFNAEKTACVRFSRAKRFSAWKKVMMRDQVVDYEDSMKYLGVTLQKSLSWTAHVNERVAKATKILNLANAAVGQKWGFNPERALWVYTAMARPTVTYGSIVWSPRITEGNRAKLNKLQRKALLSMSASMRSTPTAGMEAVLGLIPLDLCAQEMGTQARLRTRTVLQDHWDGVGDKVIGHRRHHDKILERICPLNLPIDQHTPTRVWIRDDTVENPDVILYTDGSKMECGAGAGWAAVHGDTVMAEDRIYLGSDTSVFQAEVIAIEQGLAWFAENCKNGETLTIRSDSQSAIFAILGTVSASKLVLDCKKVLRQAKENHRIALRWIKGHADHTGNELADLLARQGAMKNSVTVYPEVPLPLTMIKGKIKAHFLAKWQKRFTELNELRQTKRFFPTMDGGKIKKLAKYSRHNINLLIQVATGHALVAHHISKWTGVEDKCKLCLEDFETTEHLFYDCPRLELERRNLLASTSRRTREQEIITFFGIPSLVNLMEDRSRSCYERLRRESPGHGGA